MEHPEFWVVRPSALFSDWYFLPNRDMHENELYNVMTRLVIVIALLLFMVGLQHWWLFLALGIVLVIAMWWVRMSPQKNVQSEGNDGKSNDGKSRVEHYSCSSKMSLNQSQHAGSSTKLEIIPGGEIKNVGNIPTSEIVPSSGAIDILPRRK